MEDPKEGKALPSEYAVPVYKIVLKSGGQKEFDQVRRPGQGVEEEVKGRSRGLLGGGFRGVGCAHYGHY